MTVAGRVEALITVPAGGLAISAQNLAGGPSTVTLPAASYYWTAVAAYQALVVELETQLNTSRPSGWTVTFSATTGQVTIDCSSEPWSITWTSTLLRDLLGFTTNGNISSVTTPQTGSRQVRGLWRPDCVLDLDGDPEMCPSMTDLRATRSPQGLVISAVGNRYFRHTKLVWPAVPLYRFRTAQADLSGAAWETFLLDTQLKQTIPASSVSCAALFSPGSRVQIYDHAGKRYGADAVAGMSGWFMQGLADLESIKTTPGWTGLFRIEVPELVSDG